MKDLINVILRELRIIRIRPVYILASAGVLIFNVIFYLTFFRQGLPQDLPVGLVDMDGSSTSRSFARQLDATSLSRVIRYGDIHLARQDMEKGRITSFVYIPEHFNSQVQAGLQPKLELYFNSLYFVGGALSYKSLLEMANLTSGAVQREQLRARGKTDAEIMATIKPIVVEPHQIGNPMTNYGVYLNGVLLPGILEMIVILLTIYAVGSELKYGTSRHLMRTAGSLDKALTGKMLPYTVIFVVLGVLLELFLFGPMHYPIKGAVGWMILDTVLLVVASEALGLFIISLFPVLRLAISVGAIVSVLGISLAGFTLPVEVMPVWIQGFSAIFPLRHFYMFHVQETIFGTGFAGWWQEVIHLLLFMFIPLVFRRRLEDAYMNEDYERD